MDDGKERRSKARQRAVGAARAVVWSAIGASAIGTFAVACSDSEEPDPPESTASSGVDPTGTPSACSTERTGVCPEECNIDNDRDCCEEEDARASPDGGCEFTVQEDASYCACWIEGPIPPPSIPARLAGGASGSTVDAGLRVG